MPYKLFPTFVQSESNCNQIKMAEYFLIISHILSIAFSISSSIIILNFSQYCIYEQMGEENQYLISMLSLFTIFSIIPNFIAAYIVVVIKYEKILIQYCLFFLVTLLNIFLGLFWNMIGGSILIYNNFCHPSAFVHIFTGVSLWIFIIGYDICSYLKYNKQKQYEMICADI